MLFERCVELYPIDKTIIGDYSTEQSFKVEPGGTIDNIEKWYDPILEWDDKDAFPFVVYNKEEDKFECWYFASEVVKGYINTSGKSDDFLPMTYLEGYGWNIVDIERDSIFTSDDELYAELNLPPEMSWYEKMREQVAYYFDVEAYLDGRTFTTYSALKKFVREKNLV
mgnify:CR=1 FL=1